MVGKRRREKSIISKPEPHLENSPGVMLWPVPSWAEDENPAVKSQVFFFFLSGGGLGGSFLAKVQGSVMRIVL